MIPDYYEFLCGVKILSGKKALSNLPYEMEKLGAKNAFVVTDKGVAGAGLLNHLRAALEGTKCKIGHIYEDTPVDSSARVCNEIAKIYREKKCDSLIAVGGGSCMDTAKGANIVISEETDDLMKFQGTDRLSKPMKPLIAIPTTSGTGSEVTMAAVIKDEDRHVKMPFMAEQLYPHVAVIDPVMTMTMPPKITAATGMDALTHAVEAYVCIQHNPVSDAFALSAVRLIFQHLARCVEKGEDVEARLATANAALLAGIAFSNAMVGVVHALAHATGGVCNVPHGVANAIFLPYGMEYNFGKEAERIGDLAWFMGVRTFADKPIDRARAAVQAVRDLQKKLHDLSGLPLTLKEAGVPKEKLAEIAKAAVNDGSCTYNPDDVTVKDAMALLEKAY